MAVPPNDRIQRLVDRSDDHRTGGGGTAPRVVVATWSTHRKHQSLDKNGGDTALPVAVTRRCTAHTTLVYTERTGAGAHAATPLSSPGGHHPRGGGATGQGGGAPNRTPPSRPPLLVTATRVAVHRIGHGDAPVAAPQATFRLLFFTFLTTFANVPTP